MDALSFCNFVKYLEKCMEYSESRLYCKVYLQYTVLLAHPFFCNSAIKVVSEVLSVTDKWILQANLQLTTSILISRGEKKLSIDVPMSINIK